jgi:hypothetical protein
LILLDTHISITESYNLFCTTLTGLHDELLSTLYFTAWYVALHLGFVGHYFFLIDLTRRGLPSGCPSFFFWAIRFFFCPSDISLAVTGVLSLTRFDGLQ